MNKLNLKNIVSDIPEVTRTWQECFGAHKNEI